MSIVNYKGFQIEKKSNIYGKFYCVKNHKGVLADCLSLDRAKEYINSTKKEVLTKAQLEEIACSNKELDRAIEGLKYWEEFSIRNLQRLFRESEYLDFVQFIIDYWENY